jgi:uncharacterized protein YciW
MKPRFRILDLMWLAIAVALIVSRWIDVRDLKRHYDEQLEELKTKIEKEAIYVEAARGIIKRDHEEHRSYLEELLDNMKEQEA